MIIKASELKVNDFFINCNKKVPVLAKSVEEFNCPVDGIVILVGLENGQSATLKPDDKVYMVMDLESCKKTFVKIHGPVDKSQIPKETNSGFESREVEIYGFLEGSSSSGKKESLKGLIPS